MPYLVVGELKETGSKSVVELPYEIRNKYPMIFKTVDAGMKVKARIYLNKVYNTDGDVIKEYKQLFILPVGKTYTNYYLDFTYFHIRDGIPIGYLLEFLLLTFVTEVEGRDIETPILPNEFKTEFSYAVPDEVEELVERERDALERIGRDVEVIGLLFNVGLSGVAADLTEALTRFYRADYEGSIKFFRKVVEGIRNMLKAGKVVVVNEKRTQFLYEYTSKAYQLISNFGEHAGTYGFMPEAVFSKDIAISVCRYIVSYLRGL